MLSGAAARSEWRAGRAERERDFHRVTQGLTQLPCGCWTDPGRTRHAFVRTVYTVECLNRVGQAVHVLDVTAHTEHGAAWAASRRLLRSGIATRYEMRIRGRVTALKECCNPQKPCRACDTRVPFCCY